MIDSLDGMTIFIVCVWFFSPKGAAQFVLVILNDPAIAQVKKD